MKQEEFKLSELQWILVNLSEVKLNEVIAREGMQCNKAEIELKKLCRLFLTNLKLR